MTIGSHRSDGAMRDALAAELIAMAEEDQRVRAELLAEGVLFDGYQPRMAEVHHRNALRLSAIMNQGFLCLHMCIRSRFSCCCAARCSAPDRIRQRRLHHNRNRRHRR